MGGTAPAASAGCGRWRAGPWPSGVGSRSSQRAGGKRPVGREASSQQEPREQAAARLTSPAITTE